MCVRVHMCARACIDRIVYDICTYLKRSHQLGTEGLFRKSGNSSRVKALQQHVDAYGKLPMKEVQDNVYSCHDLIQVLKTFVRHLPGGIIHFLYKSFVVAQTIKDEDDPVTNRSKEEADAFGLQLTMCLCYLLPTPNVRPCILPEALPMSTQRARVCDYTLHHAHHLCIIFPSFTHFAPCLSCTCCMQTAALIAPSAAVPHAFLCRPRRPGPANATGRTRAGQW